LTEDVITDLSRFKSLFVIGPETSLAMKNRAISLSQVAMDLGVEYVVDGSVRKAGETLRVTVQLIDPATGHRLWAERYDRPFTEIFEVQDKIVGNIVGALSVNIEHARVERSRRRPSESLNAYDHCLRAKQSFMTCSVQGFAESKKHFHKAVELDPGCAPAWAGLACAYNKDVFFMPGTNPDVSFAKARAFGEKAVAIDRMSDRAYAALSWTHMNLSNFELARELLDQATELAPNESEVLALRAYELGYLSEFDAAIAAAEQGLRMNPYSPDFYLDAKAMVCFLAGRYQDGIVTLIGGDCKGPH
jgi:tetratricopeptide (TPR) repeat protein